MTTSNSPHNELDLGVDHSRRLSTETKASMKTTEFFVFVGMVIAVVITANVYDGHGSAPDPFDATTAMRYIVYLTIAYLIARGLAKSGSPDHYDA